MRVNMVFEKEISETIRFLVPWVTISCLPGDVGVPIFLAHSLGVIISILNFTILDDAEFLSCRAFIRRPLLCYCRRFVSNYDPFSFSNQLVSIGPRLKWRFRQLSFSSDSWFGDEIWIFDPGIVGSRIDIERKLMASIIQTPVHNTGFRHGQRIWWRGLRLFLFFRLYDGNFLACISLFSNKEFGRSLVVFDPGISKHHVSLEGIGFRTLCFGLRLLLTWAANDVLIFYRRLTRLVFMKGEAMVINRQRRVLRFQQHDHEPFQATSQCFSLIKVMQKASRSFIYKMLAFYEYMKRGLNRFYLLLVSLPFGKQGYFHFFIEIVFNFLYLFHRLYLNGFMYHVNSYD